MRKILLLLVAIMLMVLIGGCVGETSHVMFPTIPGEQTFPPYWARNLYRFWPKDGSRYVRCDSSIKITFRGDLLEQEYLPAQLGLETSQFGWSPVRTELSPLSPYEWRLDPVSGSLDPDSKYRIWVETRNGWFYSAVFWTERGPDP